MRDALTCTLDSAQHIQRVVGETISEIMASELRKFLSVNGKRILPARICNRISLMGRTFF